MRDSTLKASSNTVIVKWRWSQYNLNSYQLLDGELKSAKGSINK